MPPVTKEQAELLETLQQAIIQIQSKEASEAKERRNQVFSVILLCISIVFNGILLKYFVWTTDTLYTHDKRIDLLIATSSTLLEKINSNSVNQDRAIQQIQTRLDKMGVNK